MLDLCCCSCLFWESYVPLFGRSLCCLGDRRRFSNVIVAWRDLRIRQGSFSSHFGIFVFVGRLSIVWFSTFFNGGLGASSCSSCCPTSVTYIRTCCVRLLKCDSRRAFFSSVDAAHSSMRSYLSADKRNQCGCTRSWCRMIYLIKYQAVHRGTAGRCIQPCSMVGLLFKQCILLLLPDRHVFQMVLIYIDKQRSRSLVVHNGHLQTLFGDYCSSISFYPMMLLTTVLMKHRARAKLCVVIPRRWSGVRC